MAEVEYAEFLLVVTGLVFLLALVTRVYWSGPRFALWWKDVAHALEHAEHRSSHPDYTCGHCFLCRRFERIYSSQKAQGTVHG